MTRHSAATRRGPGRTASAVFAATLALVAASLMLASRAWSQSGDERQSVAVVNMSTTPPNPDPRNALKAGWPDAGQASWNMQLDAAVRPPEPFFDPKGPGPTFRSTNSDLAFKGKYVIQGNYKGFQIWDVSNPSQPRIAGVSVCPGGQGDVSVYHNLLFLSVEDLAGRVDCGTGGVPDTVSAERFRGVRIFDISDIQHPKQIGGVQLCRGSHTNTLVEDPNDKANICIYFFGQRRVSVIERARGVFGNRGRRRPERTAIHDRSDQSAGGAPRAGQGREHSANP